jgi:hypothetical protein
MSQASFERKKPLYHVEKLSLCNEWSKRKAKNGYDDNSQLDKVSQRKCFPSVTCTVFCIFEAIAKKLK